MLLLLNNIRVNVLFSFILLSSLNCFSQSAEEFFNISANHYVNARTQQAKQTINEGFKKFPNDPKLKALAEKMKEDEKKEDQKKKDEQQKQEQEQKQKEEQQKKDQQQKQQEQDQKQKEEQQKKDQEKKEQEKEGEQEKDKKEQEKKDDIPPSVSEKLQEMEMSEEKAKMILEAMKNQEVQYLQQKKRKATKPKQKGKPDW